MRWRWRRAEMPPPGDTPARVGGTAPGWPRYGGLEREEGDPAGPSPPGSTPRRDGVNEAFPASENTSKSRMGRGERCSSPAQSGGDVPGCCHPSAPRPQGPAARGGRGGGGGGDSGGATAQPAGAARSPAA